MKKRLMEKEGFYIVLFVCFCLVVGATVVAVKTNIDNMGSRYDANADLTDQLTGDESENVVDRMPVDEVVSQPAVAETQMTTQAIVNSNPLFVKPVEKGKLLTPFSDTELVYSKTLDQYCMHAGIDVEAGLDTPVMAIADGTLVKVYTDDKYGNSIWVTHADQVMTKYCNLSTLEMVEEGDLVEKGQVISGIGNDALIESLDPPHLHFEVWIGDQPTDPSQYVEYD
jgi:murein DD-endopeptidase MepM/ murein hydrolase activator NlpD